jgi:hypothetical protein
MIKVTNSYNFPKIKDTKINFEQKKTHCRVKKDMKKTSKRRLLDVFFLIGNGFAWYFMFDRHNQKLFYTKYPRVVDKQVQRYDISIFFALTSECENQSCSVVLSQMASNRLIFVDVRK